MGPNLGYFLLISDAKKKMNGIKSCSIGVAAFAVAISIFSSLDIYWSLYILGLVSSALMGIVLYLMIIWQISPKIKESNHISQVVQDLIASLTEELALTRENKSGYEPTPVFSRLVDNEVNHIVNDTIKYYVLSWLQPLLRDDSQALGEIEELLKKDAWIALKRLNERLIRIDKVQLLASDVIQKVTEHFSRLRLASENSSKDSCQDEASVDFHIPAFIQNEQRELDLLAKVSDILILFLLPQAYSSCTGTRSTLRDLLSKRVFYPVIDRMTDPANINQSILSWISSFLHASEKDGVSIGDQAPPSQIRMESFRTAQTYSDFLSSLQHCSDAAALKQQRFSILTEIVQATTLNNLSGDDEKASEKLRVYITQLVRAKTVVEERLQELGCDPSSDSVSKMATSLNSMDTIDNFVDCRKTLSFAAIMNTPFSRRYFYTFLEQQHQQDLLGFWAAVEELKEADKTLWHQLATEIFYTYINKPSKTIQISRPSLKKIEAFLMGDSSPEIFYEIQRNVMETLETSFYPAFLISNLCYKMLDDAHDNSIVISEPEYGFPNDSFSFSPPVTERSDNPNYLAQVHLDHINEKLQNKVQALKALRGSLKADSKVLKMLQGQVDALQDNKAEVEQHIERTEAWSEHLGQWKCHVHNVEYNEESDVLKATLVVHVPLQSSRQHQQKPPSWVCLRSVHDFHSLHKELMPYSSWLKSLALPSATGSVSNGGSSSLINFTRSPSSSSSEKKTEKARSVLQKYIDAILCDERLNQSEVIYSFLSPSHLKFSTSENSASKFQFPSLFKSRDGAKDKASERRMKWLDSKDQHRRSSDDREMLTDGADAHDVGSIGDGVAEPLYALIMELFDLRGVFKILRKSIMTFVQITYGSTINRQVKDTVAWMTSDLMVARCLRAIRSSLWPPEQVSLNDSKSEEAELANVTKQKAKSALLELAPEWLSQLVGLQASKVGISKVFDILQEKTLNKLLVYEILELLIYNIFPELVRSYAFQQFTNMSDVYVN